MMHRLDSIGYRELRETFLFARAQPQPVTADQLAAAQNLEKSKKIPAALDYYRRIVKDFPDSPQAREAAGRIKALGGK